MRQSQLFGKTLHQEPKDEISINAKLLLKAGYVDKLTAGVYSFLPLGYRVLQRITKVVREEITAIDGQEVFLPALQPKKNWETTGRWKTMDVLFKANSQTGQEYALGPTHEEIIVPLVKKYLNSYRDLPIYLYQIQTKFRDELRAKSGLLRGREFLMKDLYSFHQNEADLQAFYQKAISAYKKIFERLGLTALMTEASGGSFTKKFSHEFQVLTPAGEDIIYYCSQCNFAQNKEIHQSQKNCPKCQTLLAEAKAIEVANIFDLGTKFSQDFDLTYKDSAGHDQPVIIGCYGIGISRLMGTISEIYHDDQGLVWPKSVSPFSVHLINLSKNGARAESLYQELIQKGVETLYDDRDLGAGEKFNDADLIGISYRLVVSDKTGEKIEWKSRQESKSEVITLDKVWQRLRAEYA